MFNFSNKGNKEYLTKQQQIKRSFLKGLSVGIVAAVCVAGTYQFVFIPRVENSKNVIALNDKNKSQVIALSKNFNQGQSITNKGIKFMMVDKGMIPSDALTSIDKTIENKVIKMNLKKNTILTESMLLAKENKLTKDLRKQDYSHIKLNVDLKKGNYIDIRYKKKDGTDFIVASKKKVIDRQDDNDILIININEKERQYINNATVLAALTDATMYTTVYVNAENQPPAEVTYKPNAQIKAMIDKDPNVVKSSQEKIRSRNNSGSTVQKSVKNTNTQSTSDKKEENGNGKPVFVE